tara:strand:+ start:18038 stop:18646 length:609 start_codon:yes stop_codon:yes gene_type:complete
MKHDGFSVYRKYLAMKLHFTKDDYDYFDYGGHVHTKLETFTSRNDRYFYHKLSVKYNQDEIEDFLLANFIQANKVWSGILLEKEAHDIYLNFKKRKESFNYWFKQDLLSIARIVTDNSVSAHSLFMVHSGQHPKILKLLMGKKINYDTILVMNYHLNFIKDWNKNISEKIIWPSICKKLNKFKPFLRFNETETKMILKEVFI